MTEYKLSYTGAEIDEKLGQIDNMVKTVNGAAPDESGNVKVDIPEGGSGFTEAQISALDGMFKVCAFIKEDVSAEYAAFCTAFGIVPNEPDIPDVPDEPDEPDEPEVTLSSISATYSGGDVTVGTAVNDLTGIVVTAHYSDGSNAPVSGYTLSGTIAEGSNTVTVTYRGKSTTFTVIGVAESGDDDDFDSGLIDLTKHTIGDNANTTHEVLNKHTLVVNRPDTPTNNDYSYILVNGLTPGQTYNLYIDPYDSTVASHASVYGNKVADATNDNGYGTKIQPNTNVDSAYNPLAFTLSANEYGIIIYCYGSVTNLRLVEVG